MTQVELDPVDMWAIGVCCVYFVGVWLMLLVLGMLDSRRQTDEFLFDLAVAVFWPPIVVGSVIVAVGDWIESIWPWLPCVLKEAWFWMTALFRPYSLGRRLGRRQEWK